MAALLEDDESTLLSSATPRVAKTRARVHLLEVVEGPEGLEGRRLRLDRDSLVLGRASDVELPLESEQLSRHHARFTRRDGEYTCTDLDSLNGVLLDGLRVHSVLLRDGDQLQLGDVTLVYRGGV